jgi:hypothetical protein
MRCEQITSDSEIYTPVTHEDLLDLKSARQCVDVLEREYGDYIWFVEYDGKQGVVKIINLTLDGRKGFIIHTKEFYSVSAMEAMIKNAGGNILEHYGVKRGKADQVQLAELPTDFAGRVIHDA